MLPIKVSLSKVLTSTVDQHVDPSELFRDSLLDLNDLPINRQITDTNKRSGRKLPRNSI